MISTMKHILNGIVVGGILLGALCSLCSAQREPLTPGGQGANRQGIGQQLRRSQLHQPSRQGPKQPVFKPKQFLLTPKETAEVDQLLQAWERSSAKIKTFKCKLTRFQYIKQFGVEGVPWTQGTGELKYKRPDLGVFRIDEEKTMIAPPQAGKSAQYGKPEPGEYWVCDGKSIFEFRPKEKKVHEYQLPPGMRGQSIAQGPLPFVFNIKASELRRRYSFKIHSRNDKQIMLRALPQWKQDAVNYKEVWVILDTQRIRLTGMQIIHLDGNRDAYRFDNVKVNNVFANLTGEFAVPRVKFGWKKILHPASPAAPSASGTQPTGPLSQPRQTVIPQNTIPPNGPGTRQARSPQRSGAQRSRAQ